MNLLFLQKTPASFRDLAKRMIVAFSGQCQETLEKFNHTLVAKEPTLSSSPYCRILQHIPHLFLLNLNLMPLSLSSNHTQNTGNEGIPDYFNQNI